MCRETQVSRHTSAHAQTPHPGDLGCRDTGHASRTCQPHTDSTDTLRLRWPYLGRRPLPHRPARHVRARASASETHIGSHCGRIYRAAGMFRAPKFEGCCPSRWHTPESWLPFAVTGCLTHTTRLKLGIAQWRRLLVVTHGWLASAPHDRRRPCS